ncbi:hypothetical protein KI809_15210 [Geobacter pelophilus]|uniref:DUF4829 domain-containing protein n=1 Tax=Geoanaerobacter pelophilus TaxID=60036 RepID=A0AAW4L652_9BACT|nr:hypothetical protein [Geoanaerobacter pelophilus]MBT0665657.1 hypothetical protein [Geoanaerobacter pelophilus]
MNNRFLRLLLTLFICGITACAPTGSKDKPIKAAIMRYNQLLADGYRSMNMNPLQEVATVDQATKLYHHMAALGEGKLRMDSSLKGIAFVKIDQPKPAEATVQTKETWNFTHINITTGKKFAEEHGFIYEMKYSMKQDGNRWLITNVDTISGTSTNTVIPWPKADRSPLQHAGGNR